MGPFSTSFFRALNFCNAATDNNRTWLQDDATRKTRIHCNPVAYAFGGLWNKKYVADIPIIKTQMSVYQMRTICLVNYISLRSNNPTIRKVSTRCLKGNRQFYVPFRSRINLTSNFNRSKSWTRMQSGIPVPINDSCRHFSNFLILKIYAFKKQKLIISVSS